MTPESVFLSEKIYGPLNERVAKSLFPQKRPISFFRRIGRKRTSRVVISLVRNRKTTSPLSSLISTIESRVLVASLRAFSRKSSYVASISSVVTVAPSFQYASWLRVHRTLGNQSISQFARSPTIFFSSRE